MSQTRTHASVSLTCSPARSLAHCCFLRCSTISFLSSQPWYGRHAMWNTGHSTRTDTPGIVATTTTDLPPSTSSVYVTSEGGHTLELLGATSGGRARISPPTHEAERKPKDQLLPSGESLRQQHHTTAPQHDDQSVWRPY